jgi:WhiB family transcriptional regulator, redox-sensing transcriptional regulator
MPKYGEVDWDEAACKGSIYTDLFYTVEEQRSILQYEYINALRSVCARCPLWVTCLTYAMEHEDYGVWGGMTSVERVAMRDPKRYPNQRLRAIEELALYGITYEQIVECM